MSGFWNRWHHEGFPFISSLVPDTWTHRDEGFELTRIARALNTYYRFTAPFRLYWWKLLFAPRDHTAHVGGTPWRCVVWCRLRGHAGPIFYNPGGLEPDGRCARCLEEIA